MNKLQRNVVICLTQSNLERKEMKLHNSFLIIELGLLFDFEILKRQ